MSVYLRELEREDLPRIAAWRASRELYGWLAGDYRPATLAQEEEWFASYQSKRESDRRFAICLESGEHIGNAYLLGIDPAARSAEFHIFIAEAAHRGKGEGERAARLAIERAFGELGLATVRLGVLAENAPARALYEKLGFRAGGSTRIAKDGAGRELLQMTLAREDYRGAR